MTYFTVLKISNDFGLNLFPSSSLFQCLCSSQLALREGIFLMIRTINTKIYVIERAAYVRTA